MNLNNKVVVITGASRGIGRTLARAYAKVNASIVLNYNSSYEEIKEIYEEIISYNKNVLVFKADVSVESDVIKMYRATINRFKKVDILVNNAGLCEDNRLNMMKYEQWSRIMNVNLSGVYLMCKYFTRNMIKNNKGKVFNIASLKGQQGCVGQANYSSSKAGVIGLTKTLALELGEFGILVNAICPGYIVTDLNRKNKDKLDIAMKKSVLDIRYSLKDLTNFLIFMSSDKIKGVSGQVFNLDSRIS